MKPLKTNNEEHPSLKWIAGFFNALAFLLIFVIAIFCCIKDSAPDNIKVLVVISGLISFLMLLAISYSIDVLLKIERNTNR